jgi:hypothetical protein
MVLEDALTGRNLSPLGKAKVGNEMHWSEAIDHGSLRLICISGPGPETGRIGGRLTLVIEGMKNQ